VLQKWRYDEGDDSSFFSDESLVFFFLIALEGGREEFPDAELFVLWEFKDVELELLDMDVAILLSPRSFKEGRGDDVGVLAVLLEEVKFVLFELLPDNRFPGENCRLCWVAAAL